MSCRRGDDTRAIAVGGSAGTVDIFHETSHRAFTLCVDAEEEA